MKKIVTIRLTEDRTIDVMADVFGQWAAHPRLALNGFAVTHTPTGMAIDLLAADLVYLDAIRICNVLNYRGVEFVDDAGFSEMKWLVEATVAEVLAC